MNNLSVESEFRYVLSWFVEWSELQRDDFVPVVVEYFCLPPGCATNGLTNSISNMQINNRPSLFQCRIKLFREWTPKWPDCLKHKLKEKIIEIDTKVGEKIVNEIKSHTTKHLNGNCNGSAEGNLHVTEENGMDITAVEQQQQQNEAEIETAANVERKDTVSSADVLPTVEVAVTNEVEQVQLQTAEHIDNDATTATTAAPPHNIL